MIAPSIGTYTSRRIYVSRGISLSSDKSLASIFVREAGVARQELGAEPGNTVAITCQQDTPTGRWIFMYTRLSERRGPIGFLERIMDRYSVAAALAQWRKDTGENR